MENIANNRKSSALYIIPTVVAALSAALLVLSIFLPYATAVGGMAELCDEYSDSKAFTVGDVTMGDMKNISMVEYVHLYAVCGEVITGEQGWVLYAVLVGLMGLFALGSLGFAVLRRPVLLTVSAVLGYAVYLLYNFDFADRGVVPGESYAPGIGYYLYMVAGAVLLVCAVIMLCLRNKARQGR